MPDQTANRAVRAARILEQLADAQEVYHREFGYVWRFRNGRLFSERRLDDCFEMGDGDQVTIRLLAILDSRPDLLAKLQPGKTRASDYVALDVWREKYAPPIRSTGQLDLF